MRWKKEENQYTGFGVGVLCCPVGRRPLILVLECKTSVQNVAKSWELLIRYWLRMMEDKDELLLSCMKHIKKWPRDVLSTISSCLQVTVYNK